MNLEHLEIYILFSTLMVLNFSSSRRMFWHLNWTVLSIGIKVVKQTILQWSCVLKKWWWSTNAYLPIVMLNPKLSIITIQLNIFFDAVVVSFMSSPLAFLKKNQLWTILSAVQTQSVLLSKTKTTNKILLCMKMKFPRATVTMKNK